MKQNLWKFVEIRPGGSLVMIASQRPYCTGSHFIPNQLRGKCPSPSVRSQSIRGGDDNRQFCIPLESGLDSRLGGPTRIQPRWISRDCPQWLRREIPRRIPLGICRGIAWGIPGGYPGYLLGRLEYLQGLGAFKPYWTLPDPTRFSTLGVDRHPQLAWTRVDC